MLPSRRHSGLTRPFHPVQKSKTTIVNVNWGAGRGAMAEVAPAAHSCTHMSDADLDVLVTKINRSRSADLAVLTGRQTKQRIGTAGAVGVGAAGLVVLAVLPFTPVTMGVAAVGSGVAAGAAGGVHRLKRRGVVKKICTHIIEQMSDAPFEMRAVWGGPGRINIVVVDEAEREAQFGVEAISGDHDGLDSSNLDAAMF